MKMEEILKLIEAVSASELTDFKYEENGTKLNLKKRTAEGGDYTESGSSSGDRNCHSRSSDSRNSAKSRK